MNLKYEKLLKTNSLFAILLLGIIWSPSFLFIKIAVAEIPPLSLVALRLIIAASFLFIFLKFAKIKLPPFGKVWGHLFVMSCISMAIPFSLFSIAEQHITSAAAGMMNGIVPIFTALLAHFFIPEERFTLNRFVGISLGFCGLMLLLLPGIKTHGPNNETFGLILVGIASMCYGIGTVYARKNLKNLPSMVPPTLQLIIAAFLTSIASICFEHPWTIAPPSFRALGAVIALALLGTSFAFVLYFHIIKIGGATNVAMSTYLLPLLATFLGAVFLNEILSWQAYIAGMLILLGMMIVNGSIRLPKLKAFRNDFA